MSTPFINLEKGVVQTEYYLTVAAILPVTGQIAGCLKIILGVIQAIGGLLGLILSTPFLWSENGRKIFCRAGSHFVNGLVNIPTGVIEGTPLIGNIVAVLKVLLSLRSAGGVIAGNDGTYMLVGYKVLDEGHWNIHEPEGRFAQLAFFPL